MELWSDALGQKFNHLELDLMSYFHFFFPSFLCSIDRSTFSVAFFAIPNLTRPPMQPPQKFPPSAMFFQNPNLLLKNHLGSIPQLTTITEGIRAQPFPIP
jgi:hypothetical protein